MGAQHGTALKHGQLYKNLTIVLPQPGVCLPSSHPLWKGMLSRLCACIILLGSCLPGSQHQQAESLM